MAGIAGIVCSEPSDPAPLLEDMMEPLRFHPRSRVDRWNNTLAGLCRVQCGVCNLQPQPIFSQDNTKCIVMFGECFGYEEQKRELVRRGHAFDLGGNDVEFCLRLYEEYGEKAFSQLNGSYCIAIYDLTNRELLLISDCLGSRSLFYGETPDGKLIFSTQVSSILQSPEVSRTIDTAAVFEFCALQRVLGTKTYHQGVRMLPPASVLRYRTGKVTISPYWEFRYTPQPGSIDEYAEELAATVRRSVRRITRGSGKTAVLLSGGLDARMVVAAADNELICYSFGDYDNPEAQAARRIAEARGFEFRFLERGPDHYVDMVDTAVEIGNGMYPFNHAHALGFIEGIAQECDVVTHGSYIELFFRGTNLPKIPHEFLGLKLGYRLDPTLTKANLQDRIFHRGFSLLGRGVEDLFAPEARELLTKTLKRSAQEVIAQAAAHSPNVYEQFLWPDVYCARNVTCLFPFSLRPFINERSFAFDKEIIELYLSMPLQVCVDNRVWLKAMERLNKNVAHAVNANTGHSPYMPTAIASSIEVGKEFVGRMPLLWRLNRTGTQSAGQTARQGLSPISWARFDWLICNNPRLRQLITDTLNDPEALPPQIFDLKQVNKVLDDHLAHRGHHRMILFMLLTFGRWHKKYGRQ